jgi:TatA/E family protein of Tat protein translocase
MLSLSPAKLLVILVIALIVLGPEKLPQVARQIGAAWHDLRDWRSRIESEVRGTFPNLPPTHEVADAVRSPLAFLDRLADEHERVLQGDGDEAEESSDPAGTDALGPAPPLDAPDGNGSASSNGATAHNGATSPPGVGHAEVGRNGSVGHNGSGAGASSPPGAADTSGERAGTVVPGAFPVAPDDPSMN